MSSQIEYSELLYKLLPVGPAWPHSRDQSLSSDFIELSAYALADADVQINQLYKELSPQTTITMLNLWLAEWGLPDKCMTLLGQTEFPQDKLQQALAAKYACWGLTFKEALSAIAKAFGYNAYIERVDPFLVTSSVSDRIYDYDWSNTALVVTTENTNKTEYFLTTWTVDQPLSRFGDRVYECMVQKIVPAHLVPIFSYPDSTIEA